MDLIFIEGQLYLHVHSIHRRMKLKNSFNVFFQLNDILHLTSEDATELQYTHLINKYGHLTEHTDAFHKVFKVSQSWA